MERLKINVSTLSFLLALILFSSCHEEAGDPIPEITEFTPASGVAGDKVTIIGKNFGASREENDVRFNGALAEIISVTENTLIVTVPHEATTGKITLLFSRQTGISDSDFTILE